MVPDATAMGKWHSKAWYFDLHMQGTSHMANSAADNSATAGTISTLKSKRRQRMH